MESNKQIFAKPQITCPPHPPSEITLKCEDESNSLFDQFLATEIQAPLDHTETQTPFVPKPQEEQPANLNTNPSQYSGGQT
jgi:hypothetical protein